MSVATNFPTEPGYYWAKWRIATEGTLEGDEVTPSDFWEIVQVNDNNGEPGTMEELSVAVAGVRESQWRDGFFWGPKVAELNPIHPQSFPKPGRKDGGEPCGECRLKPGEKCDICGAEAAKGSVP